MSFKIQQFILLLLGTLCTTVVFGDTYRCLDSTGHFEYGNIPCSTDSATIKQVTTSQDVKSVSTTPVRDGSTCPLTLAPKPEPSGSSDYRDKLLDRLEADFYGEARSGRMSWVQLVDRFYEKCAELYPGYRRKDFVEVSAYQRVLAEQMDKRQISESEWVYLLEKQAAAVRARRELINNSRPSPVIIENSKPFGTNCTTTEFMGTFRTHCD